MKKKNKKNKITVYDKALAYAVRKGEVNLGMVPDKDRDKIKGIVKGPMDTSELEKASKNKYKYSKRTIKHRSNKKKKNNENFVTKFTEFNEKNNLKQMKKGFVKEFSKFNKINEDNAPIPQRIPRENKFKGVIEYSPDIEDSLVQHNFVKDEGISYGDFIIFDIMDKNYFMTDEMPNDIRPYNPSSFDHVMSNL